jgi:hypothetical protein
MAEPRIQYAKTKDGVSIALSCGQRVPTAAGMSHRYHDRQERVEGR